MIDLARSHLKEISAKAEQRRLWDDGKLTFPEADRGVFCHEYHNSKSDTRHSQGRLVAECEELESERPVLVLNAGRIPARDRDEVEENARRLFRHPRILWEESFDPNPIVRVRAKSDRSPEMERALLQRIDEILGRSVELSMR